ncbi:uncharacterized protein [Pyrus communis]|uniref:uncharacterized protein n=1 Tax=Pyrus communis TaxID=23211 RepID=UPI0035C13320
MSSSSRMMWEIDQQEEELFNQSKGMFNIQVAQNEREEDEKRRRRDDEARMGRALHSRRVMILMKQEWAEPYVPETLIEGGNDEKDVFGAMGLILVQKITATLRMLAYRVSADQVDKIARMGKSTILESLMRFCGAIKSIYTAEYLQRPTDMNLQRLLNKGKIRGFHGIIRSIDCMHWTWKKCPSVWQGTYGDRKGEKSIILEAVASFDTWI